MPSIAGQMNSSALASWMARGEVLVGQPAERVDLRRFLGECLDDADARQVLLGGRRDVAELRLEALEAAVDDAADDGQRQRHEGQDHERDDRQLDAQREHRHDDEREDGRGLGQVEDAHREHHSDGVQVVGHARHQVADALVLEVGEVLALQVVEQVVAHLELDVARRDRGPVAARGDEERLDRRDHDGQQAQRARSGRSPTGRQGGR